MRRPPVTEVFDVGRGFVVPGDQRGVAGQGGAPGVGRPTLREWKERGGEAEYKKDTRTAIAYLGATTGLAALGIATLLAAGV